MTIVLASMRKIQLLLFYPQKMGRQKHSFVQY